MTARYCAARSCRTVVNGDTLLCFRHQQAMLARPERPQGRTAALAARSRGRSSGVDRTPAGSMADRTGRFDEDPSLFTDGFDDSEQLGLFDVDNRRGGQK